jgi:8-oxo-dGTP pyrophosphatase MutT (NUDIX family)
MTVIPRPASTVILIDDNARVYMTKRPKTMKFFGGFYVFPGGAVDASDYAQNSEYIRNCKQNDSFDPAHYVAAARELFEEVGVLLSSKDGDANVHFKKESEYRRLLLNGEISFIDMLIQEGHHLNLENLTYFGNLTTPKTNPIRFDTRFFLAQLPKGQFPKPDLNEIDEATWFSPDEALTSCENGEIFLAPPTIHALKTLINYQNGSPLMMPDLDFNKLGL